MSKFDYKKEVMDSLKDGAIITSVTFAVCFGLKYLLKITSNSKARWNGCVKIIWWNRNRRSSEGLCSLQEMDR